MPYYYKHAMWLDKKEWNRLKSQASPPQEPCFEDNKYLNDLIEKSQKWIKNWPDTVEGYVEQLQKRKNKDHMKEVAEAKAFFKQKKHDDTKQAIAKARQLIFEGSSYGKQLLRYETLNAKMKKDKKEEARLEREDAILMLGLLNSETQEEKRLKKCQEELIRKYEKDVQEFQEAKKKREIENDKKIEKAKKEAECRLMKIKSLQEKYNRGKTESEAAKLNYKLIEEMEKEKRKRFEEFVEKGIKRHEDELLKKEQEEIKKQKNEHETKKLIRKQQQIAMEEWKLANCSKSNCTCDRQCVLGKSHGPWCGNRQKKTLLKPDQQDPKCTGKKPSFLSPRKKLIEDLRLREKEPTPWSGLSGAHAQFAQEAGRTLAECKYKAMAKKVVDEYRRLNNLNATTLPVENY